MVHESKGFFHRYSSFLLVSSDALLLFPLLRLEIYWFGFLLHLGKLVTNFLILLDLNYLICTSKKINVPTDLYRMPNEPKLRYNPYITTVCPRSSDLVYVISFYINGSPLLTYCNSPSFFFLLQLHNKKSLNSEVIYYAKHIMEGGLLDDEWKGGYNKAVLYIVHFDHPTPSP